MPSPGRIENLTRDLVQLLEVESRGRRLFWVNGDGFDLSTVLVPEDAGTSYVPAARFSKMGNAVKPVGCVTVSKFRSPSTM